MTIASSSVADITGIGIVDQAADGSRGQVLIEDNELFAWTGAAVSEGNNYQPSNFYDASEKLIRHNYIHHNVRDGAGYGVVVSAGGYAEVDGNVFDYNRHAISQDDSPFSGYVAHRNYILEGGKMEGGGTFGYYNQLFDVHGTGPGHYGGSAGQQFDISYNTFRGDETYWGHTRRALYLRGTPSVGLWFDNNVLVHPNQTAAAQAEPVCTTTTTATGSITTCIDNPHFYASGNQYGIDRSSDVLVGDLDGDGLDDVFLATGTTWFYSSDGRTEWRWLNDTAEVRSQVALGNFDNAPGADVFSVQNGRFYISSGARTPWAAFGVITDSPPITQLRFGDFDGDGKTDVLRSDGSLWWVSYGAATAWQPLSQAQNIALSDLRFADFDGNHKTDVFHIQNGTWYWKKDGIGGWLVLNAAQWSNVADLWFADFDGDGKADVGLLGASGRYQFWSGGTATAATPLAIPDSHNVVGLAFAVGHFVAYQYNPHPDGVLAWWRGNDSYNVYGDAGAGFAYSAGTPYFDWSGYKSMR
jgi:hypothetical protein